MLRDGRREAVIEFLEAWHGPPERKPQLGVSHDYLDLGALEQLAVAWPAAIDFNQFLDPPEVGEKRLVFLVENQGVCLWAVSDPSDPKAEVALRRDEPGEPWRVQEPGSVGGPYSFSSSRLG